MNIVISLVPPHHYDFSCNLLLVVISSSWQIRSSFYFLSSFLSPKQPVKQGRALSSREPPATIRLLEGNILPVTSSPSYAHLAFIHPPITHSLTHSHEERKAWMNNRSKGSPANSSPSDRRCCSSSIFPPLLHFSLAGREELPVVASGRPSVSLLNPPAI